MRRIRIVTGTLALLALAASAVADAPIRSAAAEPASICSGACPLPCGPCPGPCPLPCASEGSAVACSEMAPASR